MTLVYTRAMEIVWTLTYYGVFGILQVVDVEGGGIGHVRLTTYPTPQRHTTASVVFCVGGIEPTSRCLYGKQTLDTAGYPGKQTLNRVGYPDRENGEWHMTGTIQFHFKSLSTGLVVTVGDVDNPGEEFSNSIILNGRPDSMAAPRMVTATLQRTNLTLWYSLVCDDYYYGENCDIYCRPVTSWFDCDRNGQRICLSGWTGDICEIRDDTCGTNPCRHGGTCANIPHNHHVCFCTPDWTGQNCKTPVQPYPW
ncbi:delta-like protein B [Argopecten irradians]|uniref:delta-like protein B n=1 Tax=Argopecten irradians TaxID=31199 RepID=UPI0037164546